MAIMHKDDEQRAEASWADQTRLDNVLQDEQDQQRAEGSHGSHDWPAQQGHGDDQDEHQQRSQQGDEPGQGHRNGQSNRVLHADRRIDQSKQDGGQDALHTSLRR